MEKCSPFAQFGLTVCMAVTAFDERRAREGNAAHHGTMESEATMLGCRSGEPRGGPAQCSVSRLGGVALRWNLTKAVKLN